MWIKETVANKIKADWIAICSDKDIEETDAAVMSNLDLGIKVDTSPQVINNFLLKRTAKQDSSYNLSEWTRVNKSCWTIKSNI